MLSLTASLPLPAYLSDSLQTVQRFLRQEVSVSTQQPGQMQEGVHQEEFGELSSPVSLYLSPCTCLCDFMSGCLQVLLARQAVRARRRVTRRTARQRWMDAKKLLKKLRLLAKEVRVHREITGHHKDITDCMHCMRSDTSLHTTHSLQPQTTIPDAFLWLLSGSKRLAYVRIPAHSILFSLVEEQRGRDCGKVSTLYMKVIIQSLRSSVALIVCCLFISDLHCSINIHDTVKMLTILCLSR